MFEPSREENVAKAMTLLSYFERMAQDEGAQWTPNVAAAREWLALLSMQDPPGQRVNELANVVNAADVRCGSAWDEFAIYASKWIERIRAARRSLENCGR
jgi:hypothetical protein